MKGRAVMSLSKSLRRFRPLLAAAPRPPPPPLLLHAAASVTAAPAVMVAAAAAVIIVGGAGATVAGASGGDINEDEARERIYSMSLNHYFIAFGARIPEELSGKIRELPNVDWILPDSYVDEENNVFGILDIAYKDEEWERNNGRSRECWLGERMIRRIRTMEKYKHRAGTMRWRG